MGAEGGSFCCCKSAAGSAFPNRRRLPSGLDDLALAANLSARDRGAPRDSGGDEGNLSACGVDGVSDGDTIFSASLFLRACAKAASLETLPPASGVPPNSPRRGYKGWITISALRCEGTFNQGESRKKSAAEKCAVGGELGAGNPGTG